VYSARMTKTPALIIGGGIAGPVTAMALAKAGIDAVVYEEHERGSDGVGAFFTLGVNGLAALDLLDLRDTVAALGMPTPRMHMFNGSGEPLGSTSMPSHTVGRSDFYQAVRDEAVRRGVAIEYGKRLTGAELIPGGVRADFADGTSAEGALLIGADGLRSRTRTIIDPNAPRARHIGLLNTGGYAHGLKVPGPVGDGHLVFGKRCFFGYFINPNGEVWWFANPPMKREPTKAELAAITPERWRARLVELFEGESPAREIIGHTEHIFAPWNTYDFPTVPKWYNDRMVIIGDAAHATSPSAGQGASMAIEDAIVVAQCLRDNPTPASAFAAFDALRRKRVEKVVVQGKRGGSGKVQGPVGAWIRDRMLPVILKQIEKRNANAWMYDYRLDWDAKATV
jgi:2-polyprenyl-6-methoxyphenol hydroxylase-like FAD-dependent oxidoreductase